METKVFKPLYSIDKKNSIKQWTIQVENKGDFSVVKYTYGKLNGKRVECTQTITTGKNIGKKNETTHFEQAILDAESKWRRKIEIDKYTQELPVCVDDGQGKFESPMSPMLAQEYTKQKNKVRFPCYIQPKLDGYRMIFDGERCVSRTGKEFVVLKKSNLMRELDVLYKSMNVVFDGELYVHDRGFNFENYGILRKQKQLTESDACVLNQIQYHIYDVIDTRVPFSERRCMLRRVHQEIVESGLQMIKVLTTSECKDANDIEVQHLRCIDEGYEGTMIRNKDGYYRCKFRSCDLLKYKNFDDGEFEICGFTHEKDTKGDANLIVWICKTVEGKTFNVQSKGTREERQLLYKRGGEYIGKSLWVQHFGWTADGIPRFPKTLRDGVNSIRLETY